MHCETICATSHKTSDVFLDRLSYSSYEHFPSFPKCSKGSDNGARLNTSVSKQNT